MVSYRIDHIRRLVEVTAEGEVSAVDFREGQARLAADPAFDATYVLLADLRSASLSAVSSGEVRQLSQSVPFRATARRAFVVGSEGDFGVVRVFAAHNEFAGTGEVQAFRDRKSALAWLGRSDPDH